MTTATPKKRRPGRPSNESSGRTSKYIHAPSAEVAAWVAAATADGRTFNGWIRELANAAIAKRTKRGG